MSPDATVPGAALRAEDVRVLLETDFWVRIEGGGPTGSTNDDARELALAGAPEGTVVLATAQSEGRGRFGREWTSPPGGLYLSAVLRPTSHLMYGTGDLSALPLVIGLGVARGLEHLGAAPRLKWPNDVVLGGGKLAGILVESRAGAADSAWAVAGVGINVVRPAATAPPREAATPEAAPPDAARAPRTPPPDASFLSDALGEVGLARCAAAVLDGIGRQYRVFVASGFDRLADEYRARSATIGNSVVASGFSGLVFAEGEAVDIDAAGRLVVMTSEGPEAVGSGDVTLAAPS